MVLRLLVMRAGLAMRSWVGGIITIGGMKGLSRDGAIGGVTTGLGFLAMARVLWFRSIRGVIVLGNRLGMYGASIGVRLEGVAAVILVINLFREERPEFKKDSP